VSADGSPAGWIVAESTAGERLDRALARHLGVPRHRVQTWIESGRVTIDGRAPKKSGEALRAGQAVAWSPPPPSDDRVRPEAGTLSVLWSDDEMIVLDKPAGLVVHPGAGRSTGTLVHRLLAAYPELAGVGGPGRPGIVHRLDRDTTGCLVVARTPRAYEQLSRDFAARVVEKRYLAIVWGHPRAEAGRIEAPIGRHPVGRQKMSVRSSGRPAVTGWRVLARGGAVALIEFLLETGRTHQIRVHARHWRHPLAGDPVYGEPRHRNLRGEAAGALADFRRPALHAWRLALPHPVTRDRLSFEAPVPADLRELWRTATGSPLPQL